MNRPQGICNCPFKQGIGFAGAVCLLDGNPCRVQLIDGLFFACRGWSADGSPSQLQAQGFLFNGS